jgi:hypothetical protein
MKEMDDRPHFKLKTFSTDLEAGFAFLNGLTTGGGGDTPEDQLIGISRGLELWEKEGPTPSRVATKVIVVLTDAPGKSPDIKNNTWASIAKRCYDVDPAHIYPIIVGNDPTALEHAQILADKTGGKVLRATTGDVVAEAVLDAIDTATVTHGGGGGGRRPWALTGVGIIAVLLGGALLVFVKLRGAHDEEATHV